MQIKQVWENSFDIDGPILNLSYSCATEFRPDTFWLT